MKICLIFLSTHMWHCLLLYAGHAIPTSTWTASLAKWLILTVATSTQNTAYMTRSILFGQLQLEHRCYVFTKWGKRGDSLYIWHTFFHKGVARVGWWPVPCAYWLNFTKLAYWIACTLFLENLTVNLINLNKNKVPVSLILLEHDAFLLGPLNVGTLSGDISVRKL